MKNRNWSTEEEMAIVLEGLKEKRTVAGTCREHQISQSQYYKWLDRFMEGGKHGLTNVQVNGNMEGRHQKEIEHLQKIICQQAVIIDVLKETDDLLGRR